MARLLSVWLLAAGWLFSAPAFAAAGGKPADQPWNLDPMKVVIVQGDWNACRPACPRWISAEGNIADSSPQQFRKVLKQAGKQKLPVLIDSPGGSVNAALEIGRMLRKAGLDVAVAQTSFIGCAPTDKACQLPKEQKGIYKGRPATWAGYCASACPLLMAGGVTRYAQSNTIIGVHQFHNFWTSERIRYLETYRMRGGQKQVISRKVVKRNVTTHDSFGIDKAMRGKLAAYFTAMGVSVELIDEMEKAPYSSLNLLSPARREELKLVTPHSTVDSLFAKPSCGGAGQGGACPAIAVAQPAEPEMAFRRARNTTSCTDPCPEWIAAEGRITADTPARFRAALQAMAGTGLPVVLNSRGGDALAAMEIGRMIRAAGLSTVVAQTRLLGCEGVAGPCSGPESFVKPVDAIMQQFGLCTRECLYILAAGVERYPAYMAEAEFAPPGKEGSKAFTAARAYLEEMRVSPEILYPYASAGTPLRLLRNDLLRDRLGNHDRPALFLADPASCKAGSAIANCIARSPTAAMATAAAPRLAMTFLRLRARVSCGSFCPEWIFAQGPITAETPKRLSALLEAMGDDKLPLVIDSHGGDADAAMAMGRMIRAKGLTTAVAASTVIGCQPTDPACNAGRPAYEPYTGVLSPGICTDACLLVLAGGVERLGLSFRQEAVAPLDMLFYSQSGRDGPLRAAVYLAEMGIAASLAPYLNVHGPVVLEEEQLMRFGLSTTWQSPLTIADPRPCAELTPAAHCVRRDGGS